MGYGISRCQGYGNEVIHGIMGIITGTVMAYAVEWGYPGFSNEVIHRTKLVRVYSHEFNVKWPHFAQRCRSYDFVLFICSPNRFLHANAHDVKTRHPTLGNKRLLASRG